MIDIIIPAYNAAKTLDRALSSLVSQTDNNFEVYVVDDCSTDSTKEISESYSDKLKIHYIKNDVNIGCGMSRQAGIDNSRNKFIMFLDADDILMPYTIDIYNRLIKTNPNVEYVHSSVYVQRKDENGFVIEKCDTLFTQMHGKLYNRDSINKYGIKNNPICSRWADDSYFNCQCSELLSFSFNQIPTYIWTWTEGSATHSDLDYGRPKNTIFLDAMYQSSLHILKYKDKVTHLENTLKQFESEYETMTDEEKDIYNKLLLLR